jgi:hypothetical protein
VFQPIHIKRVNVIALAVFIFSLLGSPVAEKLKPLTDITGLPPCLTNRTAIFRHLEYPDRTVKPVLIPSLGEMSGRVSGAAVYYLLTEVMGYNSTLVNVDTLLDDQPVNYVLDPNDSDCVERDVWNPRLHFTMET